MLTNLQKVNRRRRISYLSSIISISLVLLILGLFGLIFIQSKQLNKIIKENIVMSVYLVDEITQAEIDNNIKVIKSIEGVKSVKYISKDVAAIDLSKEMGQDIVAFAGYNPLPASIEINLNEETASSENVKNLKSNILLLPKIAEVKYNDIIFENVNNNLGVVTIVFIGIAIIFILIAIVLINNNIRLSLFAHRFLVKSMQLVGATHWFIVKPFVIRSFFNGLYGSILAISLLLSLLYFVPFYFPQIQMLYNNSYFIYLFVFLTLTGILLSVSCSWISVNKFLKSKIEDLY